VPVPAALGPLTRHHSPAKRYRRGLCLRAEGEPTPKSEASTSISLPLAEAEDLKGVGESPPLRGSPFNPSAGGLEAAASGWFRLSLSCELGFHFYCVTILARVSRPLNLVTPQSRIGQLSTN
jgi:hypothetical protein